MSEQPFNPNQEPAAPKQPVRADLDGNPYFELTDERIALLREIQAKPVGEKVDERAAEIIRAALVEELEAYISNPEMATYDVDYDRFEELANDERIEPSRKIEDKLARICDNFQLTGPDYAVVAA